jgi:hypothetical protein
VTNLHELVESDRVVLQRQVVEHDEADEGQHQWHHFRERNVLRHKHAQVFAGLGLGLELRLGLVRERNVLRHKHAEVFAVVVQH